MYVLGIETSCDETAIGIVDQERRILANLRLSHLEAAIKYGGVIPELTARAHLQHLQPLLTQALGEANLTLQDLDAIAATAGPGLIGGVLVGTMMAKGLALSLGKPFLAINHIEAHLLTPRLEQDIPFPFLTLLISGGHCQIIYARALGDYEILGQTRDDALGESFDKVGKMMGIAYPAGPVLEQLAQKGDALRFPFPKPLYKAPGCDLSFSGLKTAVRQKIEALSPLAPQDQADIAASFQRTAALVLINRLENALEMLPSPLPPTCIVSGGVAANLFIREKLETFLGQRGMAFKAPSLALCTDNGAMVAWAGIEHLQAGNISSLDFAPRPRWPLTDL